MMKTVSWIACICGLLAVGGIGCLGSDLVISEIAWAGTAGSVSDEWIELHNQGDVAIDLAGWHIAFGDTLIPLAEVGEDTLEVRAVVLPAGAFLLLERTNDDTVSDIEADILYKGTLSNAGMVVELTNLQDDVVDSVPLLESGGWAAGTSADGAPPFCTMERTSTGDWVSNNGIICNGLDVDGNPLNGTPGQMNSAAVLAQWAPAVELIFPSEEGAVLSGFELVSWVASDPDGADSSLSMTLLISANTDDAWSVLIEGLTNAGSYSWDTSVHSSGDTYQLLIRATDVEGYVGEAVSPVFTLSSEGS